MSEETPRLGRDVFIALAAIGWADGNLDAEEADAIVRTAVEEGYELDVIAEIEAATKEPVSLDVIDRSQMTKADRLFVYAVASWLTRLDGEISQPEVEALDQLGQRLAVPERPRWHADQIVQEVLAMGDESRPDEYDLPGLRRIITERLEADAAARAAAKAAAAEAEAGSDSAEEGQEEGQEGGQEGGQEPEASDADTSEASE